ncbi:MAG: hypothetical protein P4M11_15110 [Candidatus Pacebacteria bacterium]|nr:hypothetical protein [Candidatus Paceibacterota bacterium]
MKKQRYKFKPSGGTYRRREGEVRDTAYDEEFFYYFEQFLGYEIKKQLEARGNLN